jgi:hypothetical protein
MTAHQLDAFHEHAAQFPPAITPKMAIITCRWATIVLNCLIRHTCRPFRSRKGSRTAWGRRSSGPPGENPAAARHATMWPAFSARRACFCCALVGNAEGVSGGSDESSELIVRNSIERVALDLELLRKDGGDDLQVDFRARLADLLDGSDTILDPVGIKVSQELLAELIPRALWAAGRVARLAGHELIGRQIVAALQLRCRFSGVSHPNSPQRILQANQGRKPLCPSQSPDHLPSYWPMRWRKWEDRN